MCLSCGYYNGRQVLDLAKEGAKRTTRMSTKKAQIRGEEVPSAPAPVREKKEKAEKKPVTKKQVSKKAESKE